MGLGRIGFHCAVLVAVKAVSTPVAVAVAVVGVAAMAA